MHLRLRRCPGGDMTLREQVAQAICKSRTCEGMNCCQWPANMGRTKCPVADHGYDDAADAALAVVRRQMERVAGGLHFQPMHGNVNTEAVRVWAFGMLAAAFDVG